MNINFLCDAGFTTNTTERGVTRANGLNYENYQPVQFINIQT